MKTIVCKDCFSDKELKAYITSQYQLGTCTFCGCHEIETIPIEELYDFFKELLENFVIDSSGEPIKSKIQGTWNLFSNPSTKDRILNSVIREISTDILSADDRVEFNSSIYENINYWDVLKNQLLTERRYLSDVNYLTDELGWDGFFDAQITLGKEDELFRGRLHHTTSKSAYEKHEMSCPPPNFATVGRANPHGISFLYLSDCRETVLYEIRAAYLDEVSIGTFKVNSSLDEILIADFTQVPTIFHPTRVSQKIKATLLRDKISRDLSKPIRRYDSELDYIPTQFICEFIKIYTGVQGIKFRSSLHIAGNNLVVFDQHLLECQYVNKVKIRKVEISI